MDDDTNPSRPMRPNDLCTAAYLNDVVKLQELLTVPEVDEEPPLPDEFDPAEPIEEDEDGKEAEAERSAQRAENIRVTKERLDSANLILSRLSPVNVKKFGLFLRLEDASENGEIRVVSKFKCSPHSQFVASPLHWAALGRSHDAVELLILRGADPEQRCPVFNVTPSELCEINGSKETARVIVRAIAKRRAAEEAVEESKRAREELMATRARAVEEHQRKVQTEEEAERLAEERGDEEVGGDEDVEDYSEEDES